MARGVRKSHDERIADIDLKIDEQVILKKEKIAAIDEKIKDLQAQKEQILLEKKQAQFEELKGMLDKLNLTPEEALEKLKQA